MPGASSQSKVGKKDLLIHLKLTLTEPKPPYKKWHISTSKEESPLLTVSQNSDILWRHTCYNGRASYVPSTQIVYYYSGWLTAQKLSGKVLWEHHGAPQYHVCASRDVVIAVSLEGFAKVAVFGL